MFDNKIIANNEDLKNRFIQSYSKTVVFEYDYREDATYQDYISVLATHFFAVEKLRKEKQTIFIDYKYQRNESYDEEQRQLREQFPIIILEKFD